MDEGENLAGFEDFYRHNFAAVARAVYVTLSSADEARDIAQEAFVRTWEHWGRVGRHSPLFFTLRVARNLATSRIRHLIRSRRAVDALAAERDREVASPDGEVGIAEALAGLPPRQRWAVVLCDLLEMTSTEAAAVVGVSPSTLRVHLARARERLREALDAEEGSIAATDPVPNRRS
jgi:RNA polymerase sigma-70 factor (ECF subfamily)